MTNIHPLLDPEKQRRARRYEMEKRGLGLLAGILSAIVLLAFYGTGLSERIAQSFPGRSIVWPFLLSLISLLGMWTLLSLPLSFYSGYRHEHKWNFSNQTLKGWSLDKLKSFIVSLVISSLLLGLLLWIMARFPRIWWLIAGLAMAAVGAVFAALYPVLIMPIFNTYTPIQDQALTAALAKILARGGLKSSGFFKEDMSRQTKKENAFLAGLGKTRRVVLGDNLMNAMTAPEIESIIAHEVGHYRYRHIWKNILIGTGQQIVVFWLVHQTMAAVAPRYLTSARSNLALFPLLVVMAGLFSGLLFGPLGLALSRRFESQADRYALENIAEKKAFQTALAGLANRNLSNSYPAWWVKVLFYSHPPIGERLEAADNFRERPSPPGIS